MFINRYHSNVFRHRTITEVGASECQTIEWHLGHREISVTIPEFNGMATKLSAILVWDANHRSSACSRHPVGRHERAYVGAYPQGCAPWLSPRCMRQRRRSPIISIPMTSGWTTWACLRWGRHCADLTACHSDLRVCVCAYARR